MLNQKEGFTGLGICLTRHHCCLRNATLCHAALTELLSDLGGLYVGPNAPACTSTPGPAPVCNCVIALTGHQLKQRADRLFRRTRLRVLARQVEVLTHALHRSHLWQTVCGGDSWCAARRWTPQDPTSQRPRPQTSPPPLRPLTSPQALLPVEVAGLVYVRLCMHQAACHIISVRFQSPIRQQLRQLLTAARGRCMPGSHEARHIRHPGRMPNVGDDFS